MAKGRNKKDKDDAQEAQPNAENTGTPATLPAPKPAKTPKAPKPTHVVIKCQDCGAERTIQVQDVFQVKRCVECQNKFRKECRKRYRKERKNRVAAVPASA